MPLGDLLQLIRPPPWPNPEQSVGQELGKIPKTKLLYWQATGPAREAFKDLMPKIRRVLDEKQGPIPNSYIVSFDPYMIGRSSTEAVPFIMFASQLRPERRRAMNYVKDSKILQDYPGMRAGEWLEAPHIGIQRQMGTLERHAHGKLQIPNEIVVDSFCCSDHQVSATLSFHYPDRTVKATASVEVNILGTRHYLVPSHVLTPPHPRPITQTEALDTFENDGFDFDGLMEDENSSDDDPLTTSIGSISSSDSDSRDTEERSWDESVSGSAINNDPGSSTLVTQPELDSQHSSIGESDTQPIPDEGGDKYPVVSIGLDYLLCRVVDSDIGGTLVRLPELLRMSDNLGEPSENGSIVRVLTVHGLLTGHLFRTLTHVYLPNSSSCHEVYVAHFDSPVLAGDCGAMVYDPSGKQVFGHIITGSENPTRRSTFVVPARHVHEDIVRQLDRLYSIQAWRKTTATNILEPSLSDHSSHSSKLVSNNSELVERTIVHTKDLEHQHTQKTLVSSLDDPLGKGKWNTETIDDIASQFGSRLEPHLSHGSKPSTFSQAQAGISAFASSASASSSVTETSQSPPPNPVPISSIKPYQQPANSFIPASRIIPRIIPDAGSPPQNASSSAISYLNSQRYPMALEEFSYSLDEIRAIIRATGRVEGVSGDDFFDYDKWEQDCDSITDASIMSISASDLLSEHTQATTIDNSEIASNAPSYDLDQDDTMQEPGGSNQQHDGERRCKSPGLQTIESRPQFIDSRPQSWHPQDSASSRSDGASTGRENVLPGEDVLYDGPVKIARDLSSPFLTGSLKVFRNTISNDLRFHSKIAYDSEMYRMKGANAQLIPVYAYNQGFPNVLHIRDNNTARGNGAASPNRGNAQPGGFYQFSRVQEVCDFQAKLTGEKVVLDISAVRLRIRKSRSRSNETFSSVRVQIWHEEGAAWKGTQPDAASLVTAGTMLPGLLHERRVPDLSRLVVFLGGLNEYITVFITDDIEVVPDGLTMVRLRHRKGGILKRSVSRWAGVKAHLEAKKGSEPAGFNIDGQKTDPDIIYSFDLYGTFDIEFESSPSRDIFVRKWDQVIKKRRFQRFHLDRLANYATASAAMAAQLPTRSAPR